MFEKIKKQYFLKYMENFATKSKYGILSVHFRSKRQILAI